VRNGGKRRTNANIQLEPLCLNLAFFALDRPNLPWPASSRSFFYILILHFEFAVSGVCRRIWLIHFNLPREP